MDTLDFYGTTYSLNTLGKSSFKSYFSKIASLITIALLAVVSYLIGKDFYFKTNPKVIQSSVIPSESEPVYINNKNFTIAFRLEDDYENAIPEDEAMAYPVIIYYIFKRQADGNMDPLFEKWYNPVKCSETEAKNNPLVQKLDLPTLLCIDYEQIKADLNQENDIDLYGGWDEDYVSFFYIEYHNCKIDPKTNKKYGCLSFEEAARRSDTIQYFSIYLPKTSFDPENYENAIETYYENLYFRMSPYSDFNHKMKYSLFTLKDDRGWIFEDIISSTSVDLVDEDKSFRFVSKEAYESESATLLTIDLYFQRKQVNVKRVFVKIQELAADIGGIVKLLFMFFSFLTKLYHRYKIDKILVERYLAKAKPFKNLTVNNFVSCASVEGLAKRQRVKMTLLSYLMLKIHNFDKFKDQAKVAKNLREILDIENIIKMTMLSKASPTQIKTNN